MLACFLACLFARPCFSSWKIAHLPNTDTLTLWDLEHVRTSDIISRHKFLKATRGSLNCSISGGPATRQRNEATKIARDRACNKIERGGVVVWLGGIQCAWRLRKRGVRIEMAKGTKSDNEKSEQ